MLEHRKPLIKIESALIQPIVVDGAPVVATWRGQRETPPGLLSDAIRKFNSTPVPYQIFIVGLAIANVAFPLLVIGPDELMPVILHLVVQLFSLFWVLVPLYAIRLGNYWTRARCSGLLDPDSPFKQELVRVRFMRDKLVYGEDEGTATIVDGMLLFQGWRTTFAVTSDYVRKRRPLPRTFWNRPLFGQPEQVRYSRIMHLEYVEDSHTYTIRVIRVSGNRWKKSMGESPSVERAHWAESLPAKGLNCVLPPHSPAPDSYRSGQNLKLASLGVIAFMIVHYGSAFGRLAMMGLQDFDLWLSTAVLIFSGAGFCFYCFRRASRDGHRLRLMEGGR